MKSQCVAQSGFVENGAARLPSTLAHMHVEELAIPPHDQKQSDALLAVAAGEGVFFLLDRGYLGNKHALYTSIDTGNATDDADGSGEETLAIHLQEILAIERGEPDDLVLHFVHHLIEEIQVALHLGNGDPTKIGTSAH